MRQCLSLKKRRGKKKKKPTTFSASAYSLNTALQCHAFPPRRRQSMLSSLSQPGEAGGPVALLEQRCCRFLPYWGANPPPFILRLIPSLADDLSCKGESHRGVTTVPDGRRRRARREGAGTPYKAVLITISEIYFSRSQAGICMAIFIRSARTTWQRDRVRAVGKFLFVPIARDNALAAPRPSIPRSGFVRRR